MVLYKIAGSAAQ